MYVVTLSRFMCFVCCRSSTIPLSLSSIRLFLFFGWLLVFSIYFCWFSFSFLLFFLFYFCNLCAEIRDTRIGSSIQFPSYSPTCNYYNHLFIYLFICMHNCTVSFLFLLFLGVFFYFYICCTENNYGNYQFYLLFEVNFCSDCLAHKCYSFCFVSSFIQQLIQIC